MMSRGKSDDHGSSEFVRRLLADAMPLAHVVSDGTGAGDFSYALSGGVRRSGARKPRVEIIDEAGRARWHERPPEDRDPVLWFGWDPEEGRSFCTQWPAEVWPETVVSYLATNPELPWQCLTWAAREAGLGGDDLREGLAAGNYPVLRDADHWMSEFLAQQSAEAALHWNLLWMAEAPLERREFHSEDGAVEAEGVLLDTARNPELQARFRRRGMLCVLALRRGHHLARTLAETYPDVQGGPVVLSWVSTLPKGESDQQIDAWLASLERVCSLYMRVHDEDTTQEQIAPELDQLVKKALEDWSLRGVIPVLRERGEHEQIEDLQEEARLAGWRAMQGYDLFEQRSRLTDYVRRDMERAAQRERRKARKREKKECSFSVKLEGGGQEEGDEANLLEMMEDEKAGIDAVLAQAGLEQRLAALGEETPEREVLADYLEEARRDPGASQADICRRLASRCGVSAQTALKRFQRAIEKVRRNS